MIFSKEEEQELAKELCFYLAQVQDCDLKCATCEGNKKWKQYKIPAKRVAEKWEKIKK